MNRSLSTTSAIGLRFRHRVALLVLAAALAMAGALAAPAPARAQSDEDILRFLLGAVAVAIIVRAIDDNHRPIYLGARVLPDSCLETVRIEGRQVDLYHRGCLRRGGYQDLPERCAVSYRTTSGRRHGYEARCLYRAGYRAEGHQARPDRRRLPARCELTYRIGGDSAIGYDEFCLRNAGFDGLPRRCERTTRGGDILYDGQCLWDAGYRRAGR
jgi:hypothetical protein